MEKSIETIWKEGFLNSDTLVVPKLNNLYTQKSIHIIDKFKRMFKINLIAIVAFSVLALIGSFFVNMPYMGIAMFFLLNALVLVNNKLLKGLNKIDKGQSSYQYLKAFDGWMKEQLSVNSRMSRIIYPYSFLAIVLGAYLGNIGGGLPGEKLIAELITRFPNLTLIYGFPIVGVIGVVTISLLLLIFAPFIYKFDVYLVYGRVFRKLDELISDIEELRQ